MVAILMMPAKLATLGPLKIKVFQNKGYDAIIFSMRDQRNFIMWLKLYCRCSRYHKLNFIRIWPEKTFFLIWFKFNNLGLALGINLKTYTSVAKGLKVKVRKFLGLIPTFSEVKGKNLVGGIIALLPMLNRVNYIILGCCIRWSNVVCLWVKVLVFCSNNLVIEFFDSNNSNLLMFFYLDWLPMHWWIPEKILFLASRKFIDVPIFS